MVEDCLSPPIMRCMILLAQDKGQNDFSFKDGIGPASVVRRVLHRCGTTYDSSYILYILVRGKFRESFPARESGCLVRIIIPHVVHPTSVVQHVPSAATHISGFPQSIRGAVL